MPATPAGATEPPMSDAWSEDLLDATSYRLAEQASASAGLTLEQWLERAIRCACAKPGDTTVVPRDTAATSVVADQRPARSLPWRPLLLLAPPLIVIAGFAYLRLANHSEGPRVRPPHAALVEVALPPLASTPLAEPPPAAEPLGASPQEPSDPAQLALWLQPRAERGDALAQYRLGTLYALGKGVDQDYARAAPLLQAAAENGIAEAQFDYGVLCETGHGVPKDTAEAVEWYRKASAQGYADALLSLGYAYANGSGVARSMPDAAQSFRRASELGVVDAQYNLAFLYEHGEGVAKSVIDAHAWYSIAGASGDQAAQRAADRLAHDLSAKQLRDAVARMAELQKSIKSQEP
jgi:TPR repeat protein